MTDDEREALMRSRPDGPLRAFPRPHDAIDFLVRRLDEARVERDAAIQRASEIERAITALRTVLARIEGTTAENWVAPTNAKAKPEAQYPGTLADFLRAAIAEEHA